MVHANNKKQQQGAGDRQPEQPRQPRAQPGICGGLPTAGASRRPRGLLQYNLEGLGIIGQPHRDLRPQGAATQSTGTGCIVHPTQAQVLALPSRPVLPSPSLVFSAFGPVGGGPDQPTDRLGGDQGWNSITD